MSQSKWRRIFLWRIILRFWKNVVLPLVLLAIVLAFLIWVFTLAAGCALHLHLAEKHYHGEQQPELVLEIDEPEVTLEIQDDAVVERE